jgi:hypothetical protein
MENYLVFARTEYDEPLEYQGNLEAADGGAAGKLAVDRFGEEWLELVLVPERDTHWVLREEAEMEAQA